MTVLGHHHTVVKRWFWRHKRHELAAYFMVGLLLGALGTVAALTA
jgi:hypothetical protein